MPLPPNESPNGSFGPSDKKDVGGGLVGTYWMFAMLDTTQSHKWSFSVPQKMLCTGLTSIYMENTRKGGARPAANQPPFQSWARVASSSVHYGSHGYVLT